MVIYKTLNIMNGKYYIGMDTKNDPTYLGSGTLLNQAIKKYGRDSFKKVILEECTSVEQLREQEKYWIATYNACKDKESYNIATGGTGRDTFTYNPKKEAIREKLQARTHTETTRKKISENNHQKKHSGSRLGTKWSDTQRKKMEEYWKNNHPRKGKAHSEETKRKISETKKGTKLSEQTKEKMRISANKGGTQTKVTCPYCKKQGGNTMYRWHFDNCKNKQND